MFRRLDPSAARLTITVDGRAIPAAPGDTVTIAMLAAGLVISRHAPADGKPRGPYCGMGACFECLVRIDGGARRQGCLTPVRDGMVIETGEAPTHA
jgi:NADH dehydrogenase/NADH:ubiquinone oxidoreductase subunit G